MRRAIGMWSLMLVGTLVIGALGAGEVGADEKEYRTTAKTTKLVDKTPLTGLQGQEANVVRFEMPPGWVGATHYHPGHVFVYVLDGAMTLELKGKAPVTIREGEVYHETPDQVMQAKNASPSEELEILVFQVGTQGKPMMIEAK